MEIVLVYLVAVKGLQIIFRNWCPGWCHERHQYKSATQRRCHEKL